MGSFSLWQIVLFGAGCNIIPDYISLCETRYLLSHIKRIKSRTGHLTILLLDLIYTGAIIYSGIEIFQYLRGEPSISAIELMAGFSIFSIFFYSTFITSAWVWVYYLSMGFVQLFKRYKLNKWIDVENKPLEQIALVGAILIFIIALIIQPFVSAGKERAISKFDNMLCTIFPSEICPHNARISKDEEQVLGYLSKTCEINTNEQCTEVLKPLFEKDNLNLFSLYLRTCDKNIKVCGSLASMYLNGYGVKTDFSKALLLFKIACDNENLGACRALATMYGEGKGVEQDNSKSFSLNMDACNKGDLIACSNMGNSYQNGTGVKQDYSRALSIFNTGCEHGEQTACTRLGNMFAQGLGVEQNYSRAFSLFETACKKIRFGCSRLGKMYEDGHGVKQDYSKARTLYETNCFYGSETGCIGLANMHYQGHGVKKNYSKALSLYMTACELGNQSGCSNLAVVYIKGSGVKKDYSKALSLAETSCAFGSKEGCSILSNMYSDGYGVKKDKAKARSILLRSWGKNK